MNKDDLLCKLLECGYSDLDKLSKMDIEIDSIFDYLEDIGYNSIKDNDILQGIVSTTLYKIRDIMDNKKENIIRNIDKIVLKYEEVSEQLDSEIDDYYDIIGGYVNIVEDLLIEKEEIIKLDILEDIEEFYNYSDVHVTIIKNEDIYQKYFQEELDYFKNITNISLI